MFDTGYRDCHTSNVSKIYYIHVQAGVSRLKQAKPLLLVHLLLLKSVPLFGSLGGQRESMESIRHGHLLLKQLVDHSVSNRSALALKLVADNRQTEVRLDNVV